MAQSNPTVIAASLSDDELRKGIESLVTYVDKATKQMAQSFTDSVAKIKAELASISSTKIDLPSSSGRRRSQAQEVKEEKSMVEQTTSAYDSLARSMQMATRSAFAQEATNGQRLLMEMHELERQISTIQSKMNGVSYTFTSSKLGTDQIFDVRHIENYTKVIDLIQNKIKELQALNFKLVREGDMEQANKVSHELAIWRRDLERLQNTRNVWEKQQAGLEQLRDKLAGVREQYNAMGRAMESATQATGSLEKAQATLTREQRDAQRAQQALREEFERAANMRVNDSNFAEVQDKILAIRDALLKVQGTSIISPEQIAQAKQEMDRLLAIYYRLANQTNGLFVPKATKPRRGDAFANFADMKDAMASILQISKDNIHLYDGQTASSKALNLTLKQLTDTYNKLTAAQRNSAMGQNIADEIQRTKRALSEISKQMSRPVSLKAALGLEEKTLDQIAYKIQQLRSYMGGLDTTNAKSRGEITNVTGAIDRLKQKQKELLGENERLSNSNNALSRSWNYMKNRLAFYLTVGASTQFVRNLVEVRGQYELLERSIGILIDSMQQGTQIFTQLNAMAIKSPFTTMELGAAAKQLVAYDVAAKDVVDTTKRLADMAAAVGVPIERLTYALGQIKAYGYLNARDARMFANAGIPLVKELADRFTELEGRLVSTSDVYDRIKKKAISYEDVMATVNKMTDEGGKFFNFQEKAADTLKVKIANLTLAWNNLLNEIGKDGQSMIGGALKITASLFENWRSINNALLSVLTTFGLIKAAQLVYLLLTKEATTKTQVLAITQKVFGENFGSSIINGVISMTKSMMSLTNIISFAFTALAFWLAKATFDYMDLVRANENFNKSIKDGAEENIKSIDKFFEDYKEQLASIDGAVSSDQQKMWERLQEEIEKTTKNAQQYLQVLTQISDTPTRIKSGEQILLQTQLIEKEVKRLADKELFSVGGGFADSPLADDLIDISKRANQLTKDFGDLAKAQQAFSNPNTSLGYTNAWYDYMSAINEAKSELSNFTSILDKANISKIMGDDPDMQLANLREFANTIRDAFLATEKGQKVSIEGQALLNSYLDQWVSKQAFSNDVIKDENAATIEANRSAWEIFFDQLNKSDREHLDYLIKTNQTGSDEFKALWDKAAKDMAENATTSYNLIQEQIAKLRNTPDIVINVVYRETTEKETDKQREAYRNRYIEPDVNVGLPSKQYFEEVEANTRKFGRYIKKEGEDNVEWEARLGKEYQENAKKVKSLNAQLANRAKLSEIDRKAKEDELNTLQDQQKVLEEIERDQNFNYKQFEKGKHSGGKKDPLGDALAKELQLIQDIQKLFKEYRKAGLDAQTALMLATEEYEKSLTSNNNILAKFGIKGLSGKELADMDNRKLREYYEGILGIASSKGTPKGVEALEKAIRNLNAEINKADAKKITDGLNNELAKVKDEYELAIELEATPELGDVFADMMGLSNEQLRKLPRTFNDVAEDLQQRIDKVFENNNVQARFDLASMVNPNEFEKWVKQYGHLMDDNLTTALKAYVTYATKVRKDESKKTVNEWSSLTEKYGTFQTKMLKIAKETAQEQLTVIRKYGSEAEKDNAFDLVKQIRISKDPTEVARLQQELTQLLENVVKNNPNGISITEAISNAQARQQAKLTWEDFRNSDLYSMTFEDMEYVSSRAIQAIIAKLDTLKGKVKDDPASMKALMKAYEDAEKELAKRNPFGSIITSLKKWAQASQDVKEAQLDLRLANQEVAFWEDQLSQAVRDGDTNKEAKATDKLAKARKRQASATLNLTNAENTEQKAQSKAVEAFNASSQALQNMGNALQQVTSLLGIAEDSEAGEAIKSITNGFQMMANTLSVVATMSTLAQTSMGWLGWAMASLSAVVGLFSWIIGAHDRKINKQIKESEKRVKRLENVYKELEHTIKEAYGAAEVGAKRVAIANKELELAELERQLKLEESRRGKKYDEEKVIELKGKIIDLKNEIKQDTEDITNTLMGISDVGDAAETLVSAMIEAFKEGEDYMGKYAESFEDMIDNMVMKAIVGKVVGERIQQMFDFVEANANARGQGYQAQIQAYQYQLQALDDQIIDAEHTIESMPAWKRPLDESKYKTLLEQLRKEREALMAKLVEAQGEYAQAVTPSPEDVFRARDMVGDWSAGVKEIFDAYMEAFGIKFGQNADANKNLSALQQGIQSITEDTAGAIEAYLNGVSQQVYLQSDLLTQIRDAVVGMGGDEALATNAQILLQLQQSFQVQVAIRNTMADWSNASGRAVRVELIS